MTLRERPCSSTSTRLRLVAAAGYLPASNADMNDVKNGSAARAPSDNVLPSKIDAFRLCLARTWMCLRIISHACGFKRADRRILRFWVQNYAIVV